MIVAIITGIVAFVAGIVIRKRLAEGKIESAEIKAKQIIDNAVKQTEATKKEMILEAKEEKLKMKSEIEKEIKVRRDELQLAEKRLIQKEDSLDRKSSSLDKKEETIEKKLEKLDETRNEIESLKLKEVELLEKMSNFTTEQAKVYLLESVKDDMTHEMAKVIREEENKAKEEANKRAKEVIVSAIQKCAVDHVAETTVSVVTLPSDDMKGRIIGREGRNIRALETLTGIDLIIDDTPDAVILSGFDPVRREIARITLERLIADGRIHPARIEETIAKVEKEIKDEIKETGEQALMELGVTLINPELVKLLGKLKYRTSYGQNVLKHSIEVAHLSGLLAAELGENVAMAKRAGLLHDIGKAVDYEKEGTHIEIGLELCNKYGENDIVKNALASHHGDEEPKYIISVLVQVADAISASRPGARRETLESYIKRLQKLEGIANSFKGIEKSYAIQAGREIRVMVIPEEVDDDAMVVLSREVAKQIESSMEYPGQIKVSVIRETRSVEYAK
ncbi:MAG TPA: ribonuclease Y [Clostridiales bacterium]|nr:MAG: ribonuclease Y [Clostridiales bacterium GWD2_32_59]HAN09992.1 ribonuclease Y [Clostridiales bacterium]